MQRKNKDIPMDFADATLIVISEIENINEIISIDSRNIRNEYVNNIFNYH